MTVMGWRLAITAHSPLLAFAQFRRWEKPSSNSMLKSHTEHPM
jgi:hypothetical protein